MIEKRTFISFCDFFFEAGQSSVQKGANHVRHFELLPANHRDSVSNMEEEDEDMRLAIQLSLQEAEREKEFALQNERAPGATAFLERQQTVRLNAPDTIPYTPSKLARKEESQEAPKSGLIDAATSDDDSGLASPINRKLRTPLNGSITQDDDDVVIIEHNPTTKSKSDDNTKPTRTDSQLARLLASMSDQEAAEFFAAEAEVLTANSASQPRTATNTSPSLTRTLQSSLPSLNSRANTTMLAEQPLTPMSPFIAPQRFFKLNWVVTQSRMASTRRMSYEPLPEYIRLRDLICQDAKKVIFTTFKVDMCWLIAHAPRLITTPSIVYHGQDEDPYYSSELGAHPGTPREKLWAAILEARQRTAGMASQPARAAAPTEPPFQDIRIRQDPTRHWSTPHAKVILVIYPRWLRVVVSTANLAESDWERKTQGIWFQDFPLKSETEAFHEEAPTRASLNRSGPKVPSIESNVLSEEEGAKVRALSRDFEAALKDYFSQISGQTFDLGLFDQYDYRNVRVSLVMSTMKTGTMESLRKYGHLRMSALLSKEVQPPVGTISNLPPKVYAQMSSMGKASRNWIESMRDSFATELSGSKKSTTLSIVWPTVKFVRESVDGWISGGSLCMRDKTLVDAHHLLPSLMHYEPLQKDRLSIPPHIKSYWKVYSDGTLGWMCLTSANMSKSAWGEIQKGAKFSMNNYEVGVLFLPSVLSIPATFGNDPLLSISEEKAKSPSPQTNAERIPVRLLWGSRLTMASSLMGANTYYDITLPIPFNVNASKYSTEPGAGGYAAQPWTMDRPRAEPDRNGVVLPQGFA